MAHHGKERPQPLGRAAPRAGRDVAAKWATPAKTDLAQALKKDCRITLLGCCSTSTRPPLKPESDAVLSRAREAIAANPGLPLEVQGHTDARGQQTYNQKLSEARAQVMTWFTAKGSRRHS